MPLAAIQWRQWPHAQRGRARQFAIAVASVAAVGLMATVCPLNADQ